MKRIFCCIAVGVGACASRFLLVRQPQFGPQRRPEAHRVNADRDQVDRHAQALQPIDHRCREPDSPSGRAPAGSSRSRRWSETRSACAPCPTSWPWRSGCAAPPATAGTRPTGRAAGRGSPAPAATRACACWPTRSAR